MNKLCVLVCLVSSIVIFEAVETRLNKRDAPLTVNGGNFGNGPPGGFANGPPGDFANGPPGGFANGPPGGFANGPPGGFMNGPPGGFMNGPPGGFVNGPSGGFGANGAIGPGGGYVDYQQQWLCMNPFFQMSPQCNFGRNNVGNYGQGGIYNNYQLQQQCMNPYYRMNPLCWNNGGFMDGNNVWNNGWNNGYFQNNQFPHRRWWWNLFGRNAGSNATQFEVDVNGTNSNNGTNPDNGQINSDLLPIELPSTTPSTKPSQT